ncbi:uncharacterized protein F5Z01DRAFT_675654 [Emericellopsis atlantica]|uniref:Transcription factor domain-containing protein n=1 Tax=Emericellopsis atlantica TaxID=2614577 RepID=A0A9P7ZJ35_9HYPO|nr:uncharacterized protein F5Z01DRAFT_675654 [Emericellopsis atlantica]KAG9252851.1 hypothetical protein F5Z01DRAFT_675654 [Emericellopsis atlantica]
MDDEELRPVVQPSPLETPPGNAPSPFSPSHPVTNSILALVDSFFSTLCPLPSYAFLHPESTKRRCRNGQMHRALASAIAAMTSLHTRLDVDHEAWISAAEHSVWLHLEHPTIPRLQTLLLVIYHRMEMGRFQRAFMLAATAARFASAMRLNHERPDLDPVAREVRRRILWSLKIVERYFCVGLLEFELCPMEAIYIDYPSSEDEFGTDVQGEYGAYSLHVRLEVVRRDIMKLTRSLEGLEKPLPNLMELIQHHVASLEEIRISMPPDKLGVSSPWLSRRLPMQVSFHQAHCDLYRILLPGYPEAAPPVVLSGVQAAHLREAESLCLEHAASTVQILTSLNQESSAATPLEFDTAICAYHAARLFLYISRFGRYAETRPSGEYAASRADLTVAALRRFFPSSVLVAPIIKELEHSIGVFRQRQHAVNTTTSTTTTGTAASSVEQSVDPPSGSTKPVTRQDQRLAVHSLLRQADFGEDGDEEKVNPGEVASAEELCQSLDSVSPEQRGSNATGPSPSNGLQAMPMSTTMGAFQGSGQSAWPMGGFFPVGDGQGLNSFGQVEQPLFSWGGPQDWDWLFEQGLPS